MQNMNFAECIHHHHLSLRLNAQECCCSIGIKALSLAEKIYSTQAKKGKTRISDA